RKHKFHLRPDSPLHLPNKEPILGYLNFSAKGTKREEYLEKVAKHQRYLAGDKGSNHDTPAPKPAKATKKSKPSAPKVDLRPPVTKPTSSQQPKPKPAPAKSQGKKRKLVETSDKPKEHRFDDEEVDVQRALEESLKSVYDVPRGSLPPVVIREPESEKYQPLPKNSLADQFIFQRRTSTLTGSSGHDESSSLYVELGLTNSWTNPGEHDEGHAGPNPSEEDEGQARPNPGDAVASQPLSSPIVHFVPNLERIDLEATDVSTQPHPEQMDEGFTATAYPKVQENLKLTVNEHVILKEPASSKGTLPYL
nr:hypothetical protein [Tanacetum cinerariifolium]